MVYGMNFNGMNALSFAFPRTLGQNTWAFDMFGSTGNVSPSIMSPNDAAGAYNDYQLWSFGNNADAMLLNSTLLAQQSIPLLQQFNAQIAAQWQKMMMALSANNSANLPFNINNPFGSSNRVDGSSKLSEDKIISTLEKMGQGDAVSDRVNQYITIKDKDGNEVKTTILRRLIQLCDDYRKDPKNAELSKENYETIWDIAGKYAKTGTLSSEDFAILKEIALNPGGKSEKKEEKKETKETPMTDVANYKKNDPSYKSEVTNIATEYKDALFGWGTDYTHLDNATNAINADNIVEVYDEYNRKYGINEGETLIDSIYNDFDDWTNTWYGVTGSASTFTAIHDKLAERAQNHIKKYGDEDGKLQAALDKFNKEFEAINDDNYDSKKSALKNMFADMVRAIKEAESATIKKEKASSDEE